jgi:hypothetical protein
MSKGQLMSTKLPPKSSKNPEGVKVSGDFSKAIDGVSAAGREDLHMWHETVKYHNWNGSSSCQILQKNADHTSSDSDNCHFSKLFVFHVFKFLGRHSTRSELRRKHRVLSQAQMMAVKVWTLHCGKGELLSWWDVSRVYHGIWKQKTHHGHKESPDSEVCARPKDIANYTIMELSPSIFLGIWCR